MKLFRTLALCAGLALAASSALAQTGVATLSWVAPTQHTDSTPIAAGEITGYRIDWSQCAGTAPAYTMGAITGTATVAGNVLTYTNTTLSTTWTIPHCFVVTTLASVTLTDPSTNLPTTFATSSDPSAVVWKLTLPPLAPPAKSNPPGSVAVK